MAQKSNVQVHGLKELQKEMEKLVGEMEDELQIGTDDAANLAVGTLRQNAPRGPSGNMADSITTKPLPRRDNMPQVTMVGADYNIAPHQHLVEFGSVKWQGNPFFRNTIDSMRNAMQSAIQSKAEQPVRKRGG